jgi:uncharacterized cupredoxin-like copper-binding protein
MKHDRALGALVVLLAVGTAACGSDSSSGTSNQGRVIDITMTDNAYAPNHLTVRAGEQVTFRFRNQGKVVHEAIIGTAAEQAAHEKEMKDMPGMGHGPTSGDLSVKPGASGTLTHRFDTAGEQLIGCHEVGHYAKGMKASVTVK